MLSQEERLATSPYAIVVRLRGHGFDVNILTPETVVMVFALSSSSFLSVGFSIQDETRSAPQGAHYYHADVIYLLPKLGIKTEAWGLWVCGLGLQQLGS